MSRRFERSRADHWTQPRPVHDASIRRHTHGPIQPMERPGLFTRVFRWIL
jgi:hypothetical protein